MALEKAWNKWVEDAASCTKGFKILPSKTFTVDESDSESEYDMGERQTELDDWADDETFETLSLSFYNPEKGTCKSYWIIANMCTLFSVDAALEAYDVWKLNAEERRRLITVFLRDHHELAMEELKESVKQYNITRALYEVYA